MSNEIVDVVNQLILKAKGYGSPEGKASGGVAEAAAHTLTPAPKADEQQHETNKANSGTHPEAGGKGRKGVSGGRPEGGESFEDGAREEETIEGVKGPSGKAPQGHAGSLKHEGGGQGPNHPGTATSTQPQQKSSDIDLEKDHGEDEEEDEEENEKEDNKEEEKEEKSKESGDVFLDVDEFFSELVTKSIEETKKYVDETYGSEISKSQDNEYVQAGLAKSVAATLERVEQLEKALVNVTKGMNMRKSLLKGSDNISGIKNASIEGGVTMTKSEVSSKLLDLRLNGDQSVTDNMIVKFESVPYEQGLELLGQTLKSKIGLE